MNPEYKEIYELETVSDWGTFPTYIVIYNPEEMRKKALELIEQLHTTDGDELTCYFPGIKFNWLDGDPDLEAPFTLFENQNNHHIWPPYLIVDKTPHGEITIESGVDHSEEKIWFTFPITEGNDYLKKCVEDAISLGKATIIHESEREEA